MHFLIAIVLFDTIEHSNTTTLKFWRSKSFGELGLRSHVSCLLTFSKDFIIETDEPISFKFHMQPPGKGGKEIYIHIFCPGHMTKMAAMTVCGKKLKKSSFPEPLGRSP